MKKAAFWWIGWYELATLASNDDEHDPETLRVASGKESVMKRGTLVRSTLYLASLDIKTAFAEAKPKHVAKIKDSHDTHGWIIAALLRDM